MTTKIPWVSEKAKFVRETSKFRNWIEPDADAEFPAEANRYHLYISLACPWANRTLITLYMKGLQDIIGLSVVHPVFQRTRPDDPEDDHVGWAFVDPKETLWLPGPSGLGQYSSEGSTPIPTRYTVPVLWDKVKNTIVSNESADIIRMFNSSFDVIVPSKVDLYPAKFHDDINTINEWIYNDINNGVYKCGLSTTQDEYDQAVNKLFQSLDRVEEILSKQRFLMGDVFTEADVRLYTTLIRFDEVYHVHFKTNKKMIKEYPNLLNYTRDIFQFPPVVESVDWKTLSRHIRDHYYGSHIPINTFGIVPVGPNTDYTVKHDRDRFTSATQSDFP
ncbi:hypothetical protein L914_06110 [Phytophthora nicotianae]|uniref:GST C-terminal domain-containing protein n=1 Tax=Phytophthora nicotianae TaxID=4792 RepID=W2NM19_PHYNI|nr:hypothetical protein L914_06110 [Phytophthora nicotianae]